MSDKTSDKTSDKQGYSRRDFLLHSAAGAAALAGISAVSSGAFVQGSDEIRVGLIGCGGRGTGAAKNAVSAADGVKIVAMGDIFQDKLDTSKGVLKKLGEAFAVKDDACFIGFDAYKHVIHHPEVNYVILTTPPTFRPLMFREAVEAGKPIFFEKPIAVDPPGVRSIIDSGKLAEQKKLSCVTGTIYRRADNFVKGIEFIKSGKIGRPTAGFAYYMTGPNWVRLPPEGAKATPMSKQCRNWINYPWLAGDHIVEQSVHNIDILHWVFGTPRSAFATGGKVALRMQELYGPSYDHFSVEYVFGNDERVQFTSRKIPHTESRVANRIICEGGIADLNPGHTHIRDFDGKTLLQIDSKNPLPYVGEHTDLIRSIREGNPLNEATQIAQSTLAAIMGRESGYSGKLVDWDWAMGKSQQNLGPKDIGAVTFDTPAPDVPMPVPGEYELA